MLTVCRCSEQCYRLDGPVVRCLGVWQIPGIAPWLSHTSDLKIGTAVANLHMPGIIGSLVGLVCTL